ncbi:spore coat protein [Cohnella kolymensis]|uniref:Spore coat protein n=2 Tax=Cohnella kolymensis TaxID=1590652 RepID=A0ABR5A759_9BACL|nr:spore coat protein [Cohnella kolymensis]
MYDYERQPRPHLAWHETLEMHELVAMQASNLMDFKMNLPKVQDPALRGLYSEAIQGMQQNLSELLPFYSKAPVPPKPPVRDMPPADLTPFFSGHLLGFAKSAVRNYAIAITETATPALRDTFQRQLLRAIQLHGKVFYFMLERGYYPAYNLQQLLGNDVKMAQKAMSM